MRLWRKLGGGLLLAVVVATQGALLAPQVARANMPVAVTVDGPAMSIEAMNQVQESTKMSLTAAIFTSIVNLVTFAANRLAYDAAVMLASGGTANSPLVEHRTAGEYFVDYFSAVGGEAVYLLDEELGDNGILAGFNLCAPATGSPEILLKLKMGIRNLYQRPEARCDIRQVVDNWSGYLAETAANIEGGIFRNEVILTQLAQSFDPKVNEFAVGIQLYSDILGASSQQSQIAGAQLIAQGPIKDVTDAITNRVETPASMINYEYFKNQARMKDTPFNLAETMAANSDALLQIGISAGGMFANTLLSSLTNKLYTGLFDFDAIEDIDPFEEGMWATSSREQAQQRFRSLLAVSPLEVTNYSLLGEFSSCPSQGRGLYNCVADTTFISAIARAEAGVPMTLEEAIDDGLIDGNWPLIPSTDSARDQDPYCYTYGFCHSNLVKLRKARIIPIGWELAAESSANSGSDPVTLQEVMDGFDDCNDDGDRDANHPWCKLVDPNWVLKYPDTQCRALVYGQLLETPESAMRQQECVDMPSCIAEDENGVCTGGYGYCVREENTWRFRGDSCPAYAASCLSFDDSEGEESSFVLNTVDYGPCDEDSVGCTWYWTGKDADDDGAFAWPTVTDDATTSSVTENMEDADAAQGTHEDRVYFTAAVEECDEEDGGCAELIERDGDLRLNEITNPGFEDDEDENGLPDAWAFTDSSASTVDTTGTYARTGDVAINPGTGIAYQTGIVLQQGTFYTLSYYARQVAEGDTATASMIIAFEDGDPSTTIDLRGTSYSDGCALYGSDNSILEVAGQPADDDYTRYTCTFTSPRLSDASDEVFVYVDAMPGDVWIDDVQLEQGEDVSDFHDGYSESNLSYTYVKVAPNYLGCTGGEDDPEECAGYAQVCQETEVGCTAYSPTNGDPTVYGVTSALDECPSSCVGYDTYKQEATLYEPEGDFPVYFIPDTAESCSEEEVGCDEFTRLDDESLEYFTYLRACVTPTQADANGTDDGAATFYTWEGSDLTGYQLVTWTLLESDLDSVTNEPYNGSGINEEEPGRAPCTNWTATEDGIECNDDGDDGDGHFDTDSESCDEHDDIFRNPNCREFYDDEGGIHYRDWSYTVTVNEACVSYRKTDLVGLNVDSDGDGIEDNGAANANCTESGGYFDDATATCRYYGYAEESATCSESANGCREYTGGRSRNSRVVFEETFEGGSLSSWDSNSAENVTYSNESIATDGHSIASAGQAFWSYLYDHGGACEEATDGEGCASDTGTNGGSCTVDNGDQYCGTLADELFTGKTYTVSFWAKGTGAVNVGFDINAAVTSDPAGVALGSEDPSFGSVSLSASGWEEYQLGPLDIDADMYPNFGDGTVLAFVPESGVTFYVDNIVIREGEENITLIKDSWETPAACDTDPNGESSPQYYLGCQEYTTQDGDSAYLKSFSSLCDEDVVGCDAFFATHESSSPHAQVYNATCSRLDADTSTAVDCYAELTEDESDYDTTSQFLCTIGVSQDTCQFDLDWYLPEVALATAAPHLSYGPEAEIVPADTSMFLVVNDEVECDSSARGCTEFGLPMFSADRQSVEESESVYLLDLPDEYNDVLCAHDELFCEEWTSAEEGTFYFKDPGDQTCEYRTDVTVNGSSYDGWFRAGTNEFCYGSCTDSGAACGSDADCGEGDTCNALAGSYLIGGDQSGIWMNGDADYRGWVGACDAEYNGCSEFIDVLDHAEEEFYGQGEGASYFYLDNDSLEENSLPSAQRCDGQVSQKEGCGLFQDTTSPGSLYSATATYIASTHADAIFGDRPYALVDPIDCESGDSTITEPDGDVVDLCAQRCQYSNAELYNLTGEYEGAYTYGTSCYVDSDCAAYENESGETVTATCAAGVERLENDANRVVKVNRDRQCSEWLSCSNQQTVWDERTNSYKTICGDISLCDEYSADGSSSFCSSWKQDSVADIIDIDRYTERDVSWYGDEYSGMAIPDMYPVELLTQALVSPPSGFCDMTGITYDADSDGSEDDAYDFAASTVHGTECDSDDATACTDSAEGVQGTCVDEDAQEYNLVFDAGSCSADYGESCTVGYCENTGESCSSTDDCGEAAGACITGVCYEEYGSCTSDDDCSSGGTCRAGVCALDRGGLDVENAGSCSAGGVFPLLFTGSTVRYYDSVLTKAGTCVRESCLLTPEGDPFEIEAGDGMICRGYPESDSPFPNEVVKQWKYDVDGGGINYVLTDDPADIDDPVSGGWGAQAYETVSGFSNVNLCPPNEECACTYKKMTYDAEVQYLHVDSSFADDRVGYCVGGERDGAFCSYDSEIEDSSTDLRLKNQVIEETTCESDGGECVYPTRSDTVLGMEGYCLERDTGINIHGQRDADHRACINWLPVDQLMGSTDLYAKYINAGYNGGDTNYCSYLDVYIDVTSSIVNEDNIDSTATVDKYGADGDSNIAIACSEGTGESFDGCVHEYTSCPPGYYLLLGSPWDDAEDNDNFAVMCKTGGADNDCPMVCVPRDGTITEGEFAGESCDPSNLPSGVTDSHDNVGIDVTNEDGGWESYNIEAYYYADAEKFDDAAIKMKSCVAEGREDILLGQYKTNDPSAVGEFTIGGYPDYSSTPFSERATSAYALVPEDAIGTEGSSDYVGWYNLVFNHGYYLACKEVVQTASDEMVQEAPWTDRLLNLTRNYALEPDIGTSSWGDENKFKYRATTGQRAFGQASSLSDINKDDANPPAVPACWDESTWYFSSPTLDADGLEASCESGDPSPRFSGTDPEARAYVDFYGNYQTIDFISLDGGGAADRSSPGALLREIFARSIGWARFNDPITSLPDNDEFPEDSDGEMELQDGEFEGRWDVRAEEGVPPTVWALDLTSCRDGQCEEGEENNLTLNNQNSGTQEGNKFFRSYLKFYAAAYKEQLPIRRIMIDWGDGEGPVGSPSSDNFYKNHRGLKESSDESYCESNAEWGMTSESCDPYYFNFSNIYTCSPGMIEVMQTNGDICEYDADGNLLNSPCTDVNGEYCYFQPRVHIRDNWGWCTGTCDSAYDDDQDNSEGCFESADTPAFSTSASYRENECNYDIYPNNGDTVGIDPWVYYDGVIAVSP